MQIITKESLVKTFVKNILEQLYESYEMDIDSDEITFDEWAFQNTSELGQLFYEQVGEYYGDFDDAWDSVS